MASGGNAMGFVDSILGVVEAGLSLSGTIYHSNTMRKDMETRLKELELQRDILGDQFAGQAELLRLQEQLGAASSQRLLKTAIIFIVALAIIILIAMIVWIYSKKQITGKSS